MASRKKVVEPATNKDVRNWAAEKGIEVSPRGRIKADVVSAFTKETKRPVGVPPTPAE